MKIEFTVHTDNIVEFAEILNAHDLENEITGATIEGELLIDVHYNKNDRGAIEELEELAVSDDE
ncbi:MAG: hypothetical protein WCM76_08280 [Bacteroidota bacterium]